MFESLKTNKELWDLFTKKEEYQPNFKQLDQHQRFKYQASKYQDVLEPKVSEFLFKNGLKSKYPNGKKFAVCLTHDIDAISLPRKIKLKSGLKTVLSFIIKKWDPWWNFNEIIDLEKKYNAKSSFYFLATKKGPNRGYEIKKLKKEIISIDKQGWEIGLHGGYYSYNNLKELKKEKNKLEKILNKKIIGFRSHYLRFKIPETWKLLKKAGFKYDTSFGYVETAGFKNGMCHPFNPYNLKTNKQIDILEIPLIIMDGHLFRYMKLDNKQAWKTVKYLINQAEKYNGVITILWHNTHFTEQKIKIYKKILEYCHKKNAWLTSGAQIYKFWKNNNFIQ